MGNPENIFLNALFWATARNASAPAAAAPPWSDNSREGNTTQSQSAGAVRGDRHCPLRKLVLYHLFENSGFLQNRFLKAVFSFFFVAGKPQMYPEDSEIFNRVSCSLCTGVKNMHGRYEHTSP